MDSYKIKTYNSKLVALIFLISIILFTYLIFIFHLDKSISILLFLTFFFIIQIIIDKWLTHYIEVGISNTGIQSNWHSNISGEINKTLLLSDIVKWDYVSNNMAAAFIVWTKENERLSIRVLNFFSMQDSLTEFLNAFSQRIEINNNKNTSNAIKQNKSFYETKSAKLLAIFAAFTSLIIIVVLFTKL